MYIFMFVALATAIAFIVFPQQMKDANMSLNPIEDPPPQGPFDVYIEQVRPHAGLSPALFDNFVYMLNEYECTLNDEDLDQAIGHLEELVMYSKDRAFDDSLYRDIREAAERLKG
jgi:hypothetical protein